MASEPSTSSTTENRTNEDKPYAENYLRISKENLYMVIALWMEDFDEKAPEDSDEKAYNKVGAVLVLPNDVIYAADCSRDGVHAVQRLLTRHYDKAEGSKIFMSRKPCPTCTKLLVQTKVHRVLFLPLEPEYYPSKENESKRQQVDNLFTASSIAQTRFVLEIDDSVLKRAKNKTPEADSQKVDDMVKDLKEKYKSFKGKSFKGESTWLEDIEKKLPWPAFNDIKDQFQKEFFKVLEWIARVFYIPQSKSRPGSARGERYHFERCELGSNVQDQPFPFNEKRAKCLMGIARFLATRTDDPSTGVGAVIAASPKMEILGLGWNGFPLKAHFGEFARASDKDGSNVNKKYPYVIHAEQNALLMRNKKDIERAVLFVTKTPCDECTPLIAMEGIKTVVVDEDVSGDQVSGDQKVSSRDGTAESNNKLNYKMFQKKVQEGTFDCFQTKKDPSDAKGIEASDEVKTKFGFT